MEKVIDVVGNLEATRWGKGYHDWTFVLSTWGGYLQYRQLNTSTVESFWYAEESNRNRTIKRYTEKIRGGQNAE